MSNEKITSAKSNFGKIGWAVILFTLLIYFITGTVADTLNVSVGAFAEAYHWDSNQMLAFSGIGGFVGIAVSLLLGVIIHKTNVKWPTAVSLVVFAVIWFMYGQVQSMAMYAVVVVLITAVSNAINLVSTQQIMNNWFPRKKGVALGWATMGMPLVGVLMVPLFQMMLGKGISIPFTFMAILTLVVAALTALWFKSYPEQAGAYPDNEKLSDEETAKNLKELAEYKSPFTIKKLLATKEFWLLSIVFGLLFLVLVGTVSQIVPRLLIVGMSTEQGILWMTIASATGIVGSYIWGVIDQKAGTKQTTVAFCILWVIASLLAAAGSGYNSVPLSIMSVIAFALGVGGLGNLMPSMAIQVFGRYDYSAVNKLFVPVVVGIRSFALIIMSIVLAAAGSNTAAGYRNAFLLYAAFSLIALILSFALKNKTIGKVD